MVYWERTVAGDGGGFSICKKIRHFISLFILCSSSKTLRKKSFTIQNPRLTHRGEVGSLGAWRAAGRGSGDVGAIVRGAATPTHDAERANHRLPSGHTCVNRYGNKHQHQNYQTWDQDLSVTLCVWPGSELDSELGCGTYPSGTDDGPWTTKSLVTVSPSSFICGQRTRWHTKYTAPTTNNAITTPTMEPMVLLGGAGGSSVGSETTEEEGRFISTCRGDYCCYYVI